MSAAGEAPSEGAPSDLETDRDLKEADTPMVAKLAASVTAASGVFVALCGLQILGLRFYSDWLDYVTYVQMASGVAQIFVGAMIFRARPWAVYAGAGGGAIVALGMIGWFFFFLFGLGLSCMVLITPPISALAAILSGASISSVARTAAARRRLSERGLGLGL